MNALVIYDSVFGNTEKIARAIGAALGSQGNAATLPVGQATADKVRGLDVLVVGSPTRSLRPTEAVAKFLSQLPKESLRGVRVAAFDTRWALENIDSGFLRVVVGKGGYAANAIARALKKKGGSLIASPEGFLVTGLEGPLKEGELERAAEWAAQLLQLNPERSN
jgi:flavodoxin